MPSRSRRVSAIALAAATVAAAAGIGLWAATRDDEAPPPPSRPYAYEIPVVPVHHDPSHVSPDRRIVRADIDPVRAPVIDLRTNLPEPPVERIQLQPDVLFHYRDWHLTETGKRLVHAAGEEMRSHERIEWVRIAGHTDARGPARFNLRLSRKRIASVIKALGSVPGRPRIRRRPYGEARPVEPNIHPDGSDDPAGRRLNRRVVIAFKPAT